MVTELWTISRNSMRTAQPTSGPHMFSLLGRLQHNTVPVTVLEAYLTVASSCLTSSLEGMTPARAATAVLTDGQAAATMQ